MPQASLTNTQMFNSATMTLSSPPISEINIMSVFSFPFCVLCAICSICVFMCYMHMSIQVFLYHSTPHYLESRSLPILETHILDKSEFQQAPRNYFAQSFRAGVTGTHNNPWVL